ncbi:MAG TPA: hypoxanthine phosphoribosyltransferase [Acidimicrobiales bacterium]|nr:hypoxanthine phosphoribosyltransferase [Acidimicrobiales bacterium]
MTGPTARPLIEPDDLKAATLRLGAEITSDHPEGVVLVGLLKGSVCFLADLARRIEAPVKCDFLSVSAYGSGGGRVRILKDLDLDICGERVILVEDIVDTGLTVNYVLGELARRDPASLSVCALLDRPARRLLPIDIAYLGFSIPDEYVIGYGLDFEGRYRNLNRLYAADVPTLEINPDAYVEQAFGE